MGGFLLAILAAVVVGLFGVYGFFVLKGVLVWWRNQRG